MIYTNIDATRDCTLLAFPNTAVKSSCKKTEGTRCICMHLWALPYESINPNKVILVFCSFCLFLFRGKQNTG
ncbi:hypothetical protein BCR43DRAFT_489648 [Syncephalastrum racemosum]|uniref:Uncharacterized protein n=1 Tax=Syncephalastrum racemosum TaxID=13706 RepID=A0A1X2HFX5_SYNRA|nr:hypothetical protein BCR43DRAFT_489648 [Syncephalastrum racemosum]